MAKPKLGFEFMAILCQAVLIVLYALFVRFDASGVGADQGTAQVAVIKTYPFF